MKRVAYLFAAGVVVLASMAPATAAAGDVDWSASLNGSANDYDQASAIAVSPDGSKVFVTGVLVSASTQKDLFVAAYATDTGHRLWLRRFDGLRHLDDFGNDVAVDATGSTVYVTGNSVRGSSLSDIVTIAYGAKGGAVRWVSLHKEAGGNGTGVSVSVLGTRVFVGGEISNRAVTIALNKDTGVERWLAKEPLATQVHESAASHGRVVVVGQYVAPSAEQSAAWVRVYRARDGRKLWSKTFSPPGGGGADARDVVFSPDGSTVYVTGEYRAAPDPQIVTVAYAASDGTRRWRRFTTPEVNGYDSSPDIAVAPDGSAVFVSMTSWNENVESKYKTVAYASDGSDLWSAPILQDGAPDAGGQPSDIAVSPDGTTVYVTGGGGPGVIGLGLGYLTYAYDASLGGPALWYSHTQGSAVGSARAMVVAPDGGAIYLTGSIGEDVVTERFATG